MKRAVGFVTLVVSLLSAPAAGKHCALDQVPAATLLVPYFEVDLDNPAGTDTVVFITNTSPGATLAHVALWTDWAVPVLNFNIYLTGHDVQAFTLRDLIVNGIAPHTASAGQDPTDTISPQGPRSDDVNYPSCNGQLPLPNVPPVLLQHLQRSLTGLSSQFFGDLCAGQPLGDNVARGYATIDVVTNCTLSFPGDPGYFTGTAGNDNVLIGEVLLADLSTLTVFSYPVVHLEAATLPPGSRSFYGRYVGDSGADGREPLPSSFAVRYRRPSAAATSRLIVWREAGTAASSPVTCGSTPGWAPLPTRPVQLFDEQTQTTKATAALPVATEVLDLYTDLTNPYASGLAILDLDYPAFGSRPAQALVMSAIEPLSTPEESFEAHALDDACTGAHHFPLLRDGFETGFVPWSAVSGP